MMLIKKILIILAIFCSFTLTTSRRRRSRIHRKKNTGGDFSHVTPLSYVELFIMPKDGVRIYGVEWNSRIEFYNRRYETEQPDLQLSVIQMDRDIMSNVFKIQFNFKDAQDARAVKRGLDYEIFSPPEPGNFGSGQGNGPKVWSDDKSLWVAFRASEIITVQKQQRDQVGKLKRRIGEVWKFTTQLPTQRIDFVFRILQDTPKQLEEKNFYFKLLNAIVNENKKKIQ